jgi:hypothetical protein
MEALVNILFVGLEVRNDEFQPWIKETMRGLIAGWTSLEIDEDTASSALVRNKQEALRFTTQTRYTVLVATQRLCER